MSKPLLLVVASALALGACNTSTEQQGAAASAGHGSRASDQAAWMDKSVAPGDDFFSYADGSWVQEHRRSRPTVRASAASTSPTRCARRTRASCSTIIIKSNPTSGTDALIANYYKAYFNTDAIDRAGIAPAKADLDAINGIADKQQLSAAIGGTLRADTDPLNATNFQTENLFGVFVTQGLATPGEQLPYLMQGGIGLARARLLSLGRSEDGGDAHQV